MACISILEFDESKECTKRKVKHARIIRLLSDPYVYDTTAATKNTRAGEMMRLSLLEWHPRNECVYRYVFCANFLSVERTYPVVQSSRVPGVVSFLARGPTAEVTF